MLEDANQVIQKFPVKNRRTVTGSVTSWWYSGSKKSGRYERVYHGWCERPLKRLFGSIDSTSDPTV
jgi:hypothetical protein